LPRVGNPLDKLGVTVPVLAAPMAGGPTTPAMVVAAGQADGLGFLAGGYQTAEQLAAQVSEVRASTSTFGVNLFAPNPVPVDPDAYRRYATAIQAEADLGGRAPVEDTDFWQDKVDLLMTDPVPVVSFTFGIPGPEVIAALRTAGSVLIQTVTSPDEARRAEAAGVDLLAVQSSQAGGHSGTLTPQRIPDPVPLPELIRRIRSAVLLPVVAAGGITDPEDVVAVLAEGAVAAMIGTALLRTSESGASPPYQSALAEGTHLGTVVTRAFTGRPARALPNRFTRRYDSLAPTGYPAVHHLTSPLRKASAAAGDSGCINLWAGVGHRFAREESTAGCLRRLAELA